MSRLIATIEKIERVETLNIVTFECSGQQLKMVSLELNENIQRGIKVILACKPFSVAVAKPTVDVEVFAQMLSYSNQIRVKIAALKVGILLSSITLKFGDFTLESIVTSEAVEKMMLKEGDEVLALIKANELSIQEILDD